MTLIFSNNGNQRKPILVPGPVELGDQAGNIATKDESWFEKGFQIKPEDYNLKADHTILNALKREHAQRMQIALAEYNKNLPRPRGC